MSDKRPKLERARSAAEKENQPLQRSGSQLRRQYSQQEPPRRMSSEGVDNTMQLPQQRRMQSQNQQYQQQQQQIQHQQQQQQHQQPQHQQYQPPSVYQTHQQPMVGNNPTQQQFPAQQQQHSVISHPHSTMYPDDDPKYYQVCVPVG